MAKRKRRRPARRRAAAAPAPPPGGVQLARLVRKRVAESEAPRELLRRVAGGELPVSVEGVQGSFAALLLHWLREAAGAPLVVVTPTEQEADLLAGDLRLTAESPAGGGLPAAGAYRASPALAATAPASRSAAHAGSVSAPDAVSAADAAIGNGRAAGAIAPAAAAAVGGRDRVRRFPWWGLLPYASASPLPAVFGERAGVLAELVTAPEQIDILVTSLRALLNPVPPADYLRERVFRVAVGSDLDPIEVEQQLVTLGYVRVPRVSIHGEFSVKGEVIDVYPYDREHAVRAVLDFDTVEELREFEPATQRSVAALQEAAVYPAREVHMAGPELAALTDNLEQPALPEEGRELFLDAVRRDPDARGAEMFYPLCFAEPASLLEILPPGALLVLAGEERLAATYDAVRKEYQTLYRQAVAGGHFGPLPKSLLLDYHRLAGGHERRVVVHELAPSAAGVEFGARPEPRLRLPCDPPRSFFGNIPYFRDEVGRLLAAGNEVLIFAVYEHQAQRLTAMLGEPGRNAQVRIFPQSISAGFALPDAGIVVIQENEIFGRKRRIPRAAAAARSEAIDSFVDLSAGDYVVHVNYGIGKYHGLQRMRVLGNERDYIDLEFGGEEHVYLPIEQVNLIQRYVGKEGRAPKLDRIGGKAWDSRKAKVRKSVEELAERLIELYARRKRVQGTAFDGDTDWQAQFEAGFPYQETEDQITCIEEVKADMEAPSPMDRLICGDVGFGKTEVALRAAFKAVMGGKQVAVLTPTTILAEQHFETFLERFEKFPVTVDMLSRFRNRQEQRAVVAAVGAGKVDVVIGTHRMIQKDVEFKNLGLLVIDEEQRFGVKHKERLKELKANIDCLTLTATPIPRTLHMSLTKIRDMSLITTPPQNRLPIETFIQEFDEELVADAIRKELARGGQVFYLHNRVRSIREISSFLVRLLPEASIEFAHGQMGEADLEEVMHRFVGGEFEVLVTTTIIENGLDIPNVNTIIIDRADMFGIAQLYQLRGRVGRSGKPAYAYLFYPKDQALTELAMKRLRIISDFTELGAGFKVAMKDLEVRGAGNLLGGEQSGDILAVGYDMYVRLLDQAIAAMAGNGRRVDLDTPDVYLELEYSGYIPDDYISEPVVKMEVYKKISGVTAADELERVHGELIDRFGPLPDVVLSLLSIAEIRIACRRLAVASLREQRGVVRVEFARLQQVSVDKVTRLIEDSQGSVRLDAARPNCLLIDTGGIGLREKSEFLSEKLGALV
ncbi:MAG: transcription-repair coupling factor [Spirochaetaceae bacterium]|nr:transcription-repair coupling factor [Spirochaetaceae bacterium]